jgi:hypothetical protein
MQYPRLYYVFSGLRENFWSLTLRYHFAVGSYVNIYPYFMTAVRNARALEFLLDTLKH